MTIALDGSTPAAVDVTYPSGNTTIATASFSPPAGSRVVIAVNFSNATNATGPTWTVADSLSNSYAAGPGVYDGTFDGSYLFSHYYATAPGSITVTATRTVNLTGATLSLAPYVLTGTAVSQAGAGSASHPGGSSTTVESSITTTAGGSWTIVAAMQGANETFTAAGVTTDHFYDDAVGGDASAAGHAVTGTPGGTTLGWTSTTAEVFSWVALEILPAATPPSSGFVMASLP